MTNIALSLNADFGPQSSSELLAGSSERLLCGIKKRFRRPGELLTAGISFMGLAFWGAHALEKCWGLGFGKERVPQIVESLAALGLGAVWTKPTLVAFGMIQGGAALCAFMSLLRGARSKFLEASIALGLAQLSLFLVADIGLGTDDARIRMLKHVGLATALVILFLAHRFATKLPDEQLAHLE